jgi:hypothetical protein
MCSARAEHTASHDSARTGNYFVAAVCHAEQCAPSRQLKLPVCSGPRSLSGGASAIVEKMPAPFAALASFSFF